MVPSHHAYRRLNVFLDYLYVLSDVSSMFPADGNAEPEPVRKDRYE